jgi:monooxygenase
VTTQTSPKVDHVDVLVVGAGISGIGAAYHLQTQRPGTTFAVVDALDSYGGTWWTHRYPGIRSDSDLYTFGYRFKPWRGNPIATAEEILRYLGDVIEDNDLARHITYRTRVERASWSSDHRRWTVELLDLETDARRQVTCGFLWMCQGYYEHRTGYTPEWEGMDRFRGAIVHPQQWPEDLDYEGKRVVVIGSGATAATLIPAIAERAGHVTMLQRSPTFFFVRPNSNEIPEEWTHEIVRRKILQDQDAITKLSFDSPELLREFLLDQIRPLLPEGFDIDKHFNPTYRPWQQRVAVLPGGDLFTAIRDGKASVVTDHIDTFTETGIRLQSGEELEADVIITATYRGIMFTGVPNLAYVFGYFRASWTLRAELIADFVCRLLAHMEEQGASMVVPKLRPDEADMPLGPWVDPENFNPGYLTRSMHLMPKQGPHDPWRLLHDYSLEKDLLPNADLEDGALEFK